MNDPASSLLRSRYISLHCRFWPSAAEPPPPFGGLVFAEQMTEGLQNFDMVTYDLDDTQRRDGEDHPGDAPEQVPGKQNDDGKKGMNTHLGLHDQGRDDIKLDRLDEYIGDKDAKHHVESAALG